MAAAKKNRQSRQYLQLADGAKRSMLSSIDSFNRVYGDYKIETTLMLLTNAWELLAKAILVKKKKNIYKDKKTKETISCEKAINQLESLKELQTQQAELIQQIVSLRNKCVHDILPKIPEEIQHHLLFYGCKFFKDLATKHFPNFSDDLGQNFLTLSFEHMTTYAAEVNKMVSRLRKGTQGEKELVWLLERGIRFVSSDEYISQKKFEEIYKKKKKISPHLKVSEHLSTTDMVVIVPVQAPQNFTADVQLRKGSGKLKGTLPVIVQKTDFESDYPFLTKDIALQVGKNQNYVATALAELKLKGDAKYHQSVRASASGAIQRYSQAALDHLKKYIKDNPDYNPYKKSTK